MRRLIESTAFAIIFAASPLLGADSQSDLLQWTQERGSQSAVLDQPQNPPPLSQTPPEQPQTPPAPPAAPPPETTPAAPPTPTPQTAPIPAPTTPAPSTNEQPSVLSRAASGAYDRHDIFPSVNVYLPEGQASVRLRKLIKNVLFESQIDYNFVNGDISTFLRYKYYARTFTYRIGVFDEIGFPALGASGSTQDFQRTRGGLLLFELPRDYNHRYYWLVQRDRLTFGQVTNVDDKKTNVYTKVGYQYGTQFDERLNGIVGESRGRITPVLTAFRDLGPQKFSFGGAITESARITTGQYKYTKLEGEALKRFDVTRTSFLVSRLHAGFFVTHDQIRCNDPSVPCTFDPIQRYSIPLYEMLRLGDRGALKSIGDNSNSEGTHEAHLTNEYFVPVFRNKDFHTWAVHWSTLYAIAYAGAGSIGFNYRDIARTSNDVFDAGLGAETSLTFRDYDVILSVIYAHTLHAPDALTGGKVRFSIRTSR
jgi:hypothetical protein